MNAKYFLFLVVVLFFSNCRNQRIDSRIIQAESLLYENPDSAYRLLSSIELPQESSEQSYANWCLLITSARDKSYRPHWSDKEIKYAVSYFSKKADARRLGQAYYTAGRVASELGDNYEAIQYYLNAETESLKVSDYLQLYLITSQLGTLYAYQSLLPETNEAYQRACQYAKLSGKPTYLAESYAHIGRMYGMQGMWEKADSCYSLSIEMFQEIGDYKNFCGLLNERAANAIRAHKYDLAEACFREIDLFAEKLRDDSPLYLTRGNLYRLKEDYEQAFRYLEKVLRTSNIYTRSSTYQALSYLFEDLKQYDKAFQYAQLYIEIKDSIRQSELQKTMMEISAQYHRAQLKAQNKELVWRNKQLFYWSICICLFAILVFVLERRFYHLRLKEKQRKWADAVRIIDAMEAEQSKNLKKIEDLQVQRDLLRSSLSDKNQKADDDIRSYEKKNKELESQLSLLKKQMKDKSFSLIYQEIADMWNKFLKRFTEDPTYMDEMEESLLITFTDISYSRFYSKLKNQYPGLSHADLCKLCMLKLNFSTKEISVMTNITEKAVRQWKTRVKVKLGLTKENVLSVDEFVESFCSVRRKKYKNRTAL